MNMDGLSARQAEKLQQQVAGHLAYLDKLIGRMEAIGFPQADRFYVSATKAHSVTRIRREHHRLT